jgi:hypothetical protein
MAVVAVGGLVIATVIQQSGMFSEPLSTSCLTLTTTAGSEKLQPSDGDLEKHQGANRDSVRLHVERCRPDDCNGDDLKYYIASVENYAKSRMWDIQRMHKTFGAPGVDLIQRRFAESVSDRQILASQKSMRQAGKLKPISQTADWSIYYNLLIQSGGKPVPICYKPKAQG